VRRWEGINNLFSRSDPCGVVLSRVNSSHDCREREPSDSNIVECLKVMLALEAQGPTTYIIMDALDECPTTSTIPSPQEQVLELVDKLAGLHLQSVHIRVPSRPEHDIQTALKCLNRHSVSLQDDNRILRTLLVCSLKPKDAEMARGGQGSNC
jgi:hypothetical protein